MVVPEQSDSSPNKLCSSGKLFVCGTPIGNLEDASARLIRVLGEVNVVAAEDTRVTMRLLNHHGIKTTVMSYHEHNKRSRGPELLEAILNGKDVALVSDAGMPSISDPGEDLVRSATEAGINIVPIPGATAATTALAVSGLDTSRFRFEGFLPRKGAERKRLLDELGRESCTLVFYESPRRLTQTIRDMIERLGDRRAVVCRELTKIHEEIVRGRLSHLLEHFEQGQTRGEVVLVVSGAEPVSGGGAGVAKDRLAEATGVKPELLVAKLMNAGIAKKDAIRLVAELTNLPRREVYSRSVQLRSTAKRD